MYHTNTYIYINKKIKFHTLTDYSLYSPLSFFTNNPQSRMVVSTDFAWLKSNLLRFNEIIPQDIENGLHYYNSNGVVINTLNRIYEKCIKISTDRLQYPNIDKPFEKKKLEKYITKILALHNVGEYIGNLFLVDLPTKTCVIINK